MRFLFLLISPVLFLGCTSSNTERIQHNTTKENNTPSQEQEKNNPAPPRVSLFREQDKNEKQYPVTKIQDGNTLIVDIDGTETPVRLLGIQSLKNTECYSNKAKEYLEKNIQGKKVLLRKSVRGKDAQGNTLLRYAFFKGNDLGSELLRKGLVVLPEDIRHDLAHNYFSLYTEGRYTKQGMWNPENCPKK